MNDFDIVNSIEWHDGVLLETKTTFKKKHSNMILIIEIYKKKDAKFRDEMIIEFFDIDNLTFTVDTVELNDNYRSGNISNGYIKEISNKEKYKFFLYLSDGLLGLTFKECRLIE